MQGNYYQEKTKYLNISFLWINNLILNLKSLSLRPKI